MKKTMYLLNEKWNSLRAASRWRARPDFFLLIIGLGELGKTIISNEALLSTM